ncbi:MAG: hypothetical protein FWG93_03120 [Oscillospiraceae bacterium]|nr:hypothetical protein [Oscillospiraceae bacterium]
MAFKRLAAPARQIFQIDRFRGVDLNNAPSNVDPGRSPDAPNMVRGETGKVRKRPGYYTEAVRCTEADGSPARINGVHFRNGIRIVHAGTRLHWTVPGESAPRVWAGMADTRSRSRTLGGRLCLLDGKRLLLFDGETFTPAEEAAYIPTLMISRAPSGGGTVLEPLNLLSRRWREQFLSNGSDRVYHLTAKDLAADAVTVETLDAGGAWVTLDPSQYSADPAAGTVTFNTAPGPSPVSGHDNVRITAAKDRPDSLAKISGCTVMEAYGVGGAPDRLFLSGNPAFPGMDFYSQMGDPTYFGDTWFSNLGQDSAEITGYSVVGSLLAAHLRTGAGTGGIIVRGGTMLEGQAAFPVVNTLSGEAAIAPGAFATLGKEPFFLTRRGVYSITAEELTGERYSQQRSFYIAPALQREPEPENAFAAVWNDFYLLALNRRVYLLDGLQKTYQTAEPYSSHQCECYFWTDIDARVMWQEDGQLCFGTGGGDICRFHTDADNPQSYSDDGRPIAAHWDTPDLSGQFFFRNKTFRRVSVSLQSAPVTSVSVHVQRKGLWQSVLRGGGKFRFLDLGYFDWSGVSFSSDRTPKSVTGRIRVRKTGKARFRFANEAPREMFGLYSLALEYSESGIHGKY